MTQLLEEHSFIFDLDKTLWNTYNKHGQEIWAKQLIPPYALEGKDKVVDDSFSYCVLKPGARLFLNFLHSQGKSIGFISLGSLFAAPHNKQPSLILLKMFGLYDLFNGEKILDYKTSSKAQYFKSRCVFFDDDKKVLDSVKDIPHVQAYDSNNITDWASLL